MNYICYRFLSDNQTTISIFLELQDLCMKIIMCWPSCWRLFPSTLVTGVQFSLKNYLCMKSVQLPPEKKSLGQSGMWIEVVGFHDSNRFPKHDVFLTIHRYCERNLTLVCSMCIKTNFCLLKNKWKQLTKQRNSHRYCKIMKEQDVEPLWHFQGQSNSSILVHELLDLQKNVLQMIPGDQKDNQRYYISTEKQTFKKINVNEVPWEPTDCWLQEEK